MEDPAVYTANRRRSDGSEASSLRPCSLTEGTTLEVFDYEWLA